MQGEGVNISTVLRVYLSPLMLASSSVFFAYTLAQFLLEGNVPVVQAALVAVLATISYVGLLWVFMPATFSVMTAHVASVFSRSRQAGDSI
jgi:hypothetical protein